MASNTTKDSVIALTKRTLFDVFAEKDASKRLSMIEQAWVASGDCLFIDANGVYTTHEAIDDMIAGLQKLIEGQELRELGEYTVLHPDNSDTWVVKVGWGIGTKDGEPNMTGMDVVTVVEGKVKSVYTFIDGRQ